MYTHSTDSALYRPDLPCSELDRLSIRVLNLVCIARNPEITVHILVLVDLSTHYTSLQPATSYTGYCCVPRYSRSRSFYTRVPTAVSTRVSRYWFGGVEWFHHMGPMVSPIV
jgi:hypothetical protein